MSPSCRLTSMGSSYFFQLVISHVVSNGMNGRGADEERKARFHLSTEVEEWCPAQAIVFQNQLAALTSTSMEPGGRSGGAGTSCAIVSVADGSLLLRTEMLAQGQVLWHKSRCHHEVNVVSCTVEICGYNYVKSAP